MPVARQPKRLGLAQTLYQAENGLILILVGAVRAPGADHRAAKEGVALDDCLLYRIPDTIEVARPNRIVRLPHVGWLRGPDSEQVDNVQLAAFPMPTEAQAFADGRIIDLTVRCGGIEHDERGDTAAIGDPSIQVITVLAVCGKDG